MEEYRIPESRQIGRFRILGNGSENKSAYATARGWRLSRGIASTFGKKVMRELIIPPAAKEDEDSLEMLRAWVIHGDLQVAMSSWVWKEDSKPWGQLLAETIHHLSTALEAETERPRSEIAAEIKKSLDHHFANPRDCLIGDFVDRSSPDEGEPNKAR